MLKLRSVRNLLVATSLLACAAPVHAADTYPSKPGRLILPFGPGASTDIIGRIFAQRFSEAWGQTLVVDNRPGAGGTLGTAMAAKAAPDGYTIFTYGINQTITPNLYKNLPYDPQRDFIPVSLYATMPNILCINPGLPVRNVGEFIKLLKAHPGKYKYASSGIGASPHLTMELFKSVVGVDLIHVPYKAAGQGYIDTMTGEMKVNRVDILHDVGKSLNPAIDIGQIEGGFVQGMGWLTTEELVWDSAGRLRTHAPSTYKIPCASDVPDDFRVEIFRSSGNREETIHRSKAVGEPPLMLAISVFSAITNAIASLKPGAVPRVDAPATPEAIMRAVRGIGDGAAR